MRCIDLGLALRLVGTGIPGTLMSLGGDLWPAARRAAVNLSDHFAMPPAGEAGQDSAQGTASVVNP